MEEVEAQLLEVFTEADASKQIRAAYNQLMKEIVREKILTEGFRIDGRAAEDIRDLGVEIGLIPRVHGSALFERGETQILGVTTLDMLKMEQTIDSLTPVESSATSTTTTSRHTPPVRPDALALQSVAKLVTVHWLSVHCCQLSLPAKTSRTPFARSLRHWAPTVRLRWVPFVLRRCRCTTQVFH